MVGEKEVAWVFKWYVVNVKKGGVITEAPRELDYKLFKKYSVAQKYLQDILIKQIYYGPNNVSYEVNRINNDSFEIITTPNNDGEYNLKSFRITELPYSDSENN